MPPDPPHARVRVRPPSPSRLRASGALLALALALLVTSIAPATPTTAADEVQSPVEAARTALADQLESSGVPGGAVVVVADGEAEARGVGSAGEAGAVTSDTRFVIGSTSKSFTALAVMQLVDDGRVDLDAPVTDYVPELRLADESADDVTVRHLLNQTSGLSDLAGGDLLASAAEGTALQAVAELEGARLASVPGEKWHYANVNFVLAGLVVERASGVTYAEYVEERIFAPLGMKRSTVLGVSSAGDVSSGHRFWFGVPLAHEPVRRAGVVAAGYLVSTASDLGRYLAMLLAQGIGPDGTRVLSEAGVRTLVAPGPAAELGVWADGADARYAMGWFVGGPWDAEATFHPGNTPDSSAMLALFPDDGVAVAVMVNAGHEMPVPGNPSLTDRINADVVGAALGEEVSGTPTLRGFYVVFDLVALALLALAAWGLVRALRAHGEALRTGGVAHPARRWIGILLRAVGVAALVLLTELVFGWAALWTWAPDLALVVGGLVGLTLITTLVRLVTLVTAGGRPRERDVDLADPGRREHSAEVVTPR